MGILDFIGEISDSVIDLAADGVIAIIDFTEKHPTVTKIGAVATITATGGVGAVVFAPQIATAIGAAGFLGTTATTGTAISSLGGVALTNASLAAIGGGALSAGGAGMVGGTAVIGAAGAAISGGVSTAVVSKK